MQSNFIFLSVWNSLHKYSLNYFFVACMIVGTWVPSGNKLKTCVSSYWTGFRNILSVETCTLFWDWFRLNHLGMTLADADFREGRNGCKRGCLGVCFILAGGWFYHKNKFPNNFLLTCPETRTRDRAENRSTSVALVGHMTNTKEELYEGNMKNTNTWWKITPSHPSRLEPKFGWSWVSSDLSLF